MGSTGVLVQTHPTTTSSVVISRSLSIGRMDPPGKLGSRLPNTVRRTHPGRVLFFPTQVCPLLSFSRERSPLTRLTGGPGEPGISHVIGFGELLSNLTGGYYDIVSWDPRGVGYTTWAFTPLCCLLLTPRFSPSTINCFDSMDQYLEFWNGTVVNPQVDIKYGFTDPIDLQYFNSQVSVMDERWKALAQICLKHETGQYLPYVGTTAAVRDLVAIAEFFDGKGCDINYWGFSYGTVIGIYLVNSTSPIPRLPTQILTMSSSVPKARWQGHLGRRGGSPHLRFSTLSPLLGPYRRVRRRDLPGLHSGMRPRRFLRVPSRHQYIHRPRHYRVDKELARCMHSRSPPARNPAYASNRSPTITPGPAG